MAPRPTWQGHLRLSLVTCPVALYTATQSSGDVHFNLLHKDTHNRIKMVTTDPELGPVDRSDLVKGYEYEKGQYVIVTPEEIESVRLESTKTIDIERFVDADDIVELGATYGSVAPVVIFLIWLSWSVNAIFFGGALATEVEIAVKSSAPKLLPDLRGERPIVSAPEN